MNQLFMVHPGPCDVPVPALPPDWRLRAATDTDDAAMAALLTDAFEETWSVERVRRELLDEPTVVRSWLVSGVDGLLGTASEKLHPKFPGVGYVHWVGVAPRARGHALGQILTQACLDGFTERGLASAVLETEDFRLPALRTYLRLGFIPEPRDDKDRRVWSQVLRQLNGSPASTADQ